MPKLRLWRPSSLTFMMGLALYILLVFNLGFWRTFYSDVPMSQDPILWWTMPLFIYVCLLGLLSLVFIWPYWRLISIPTLLILGAATSYAVWFQGIYFNATMIENIVETNVAEATHWMSQSFLIYVGLLGVAPALFTLLFTQIKWLTPWAEIRRHGWVFLGSLAVIGLLALLDYRGFATFFRNHSLIHHQIFPTNLMVSGAQAGVRYYLGHQPLVQLGLDATHESAPNRRILLLVVGETTRAANWGLNGYARQTTPQLASTPGVINFKEASSCGTSTVVSVPCLFSNMTRSNYNPIAVMHTEGLMDVLSHAKIDTYWRENDGGCKGACDRIRNDDVIQWAPHSDCQAGGCLDKYLLTHLKEEIQKMKGDSVVVLHMVGNHGPAYHLRYEPQYRQYTPTCDTQDIQTCSNDQLVNTYDNGVLQVDANLKAAIDVLKSFPDAQTALWYFSDHGESLGEKGLYLHGAPYFIAPKTQTHIPMVFWANEHFYKGTHLDEACLTKLANDSIGHDHVFHTTLGLMKVSTSVYDPTLDAFAACRAKD